MYCKVVMRGGRRFSLSVLAFGLVQLTLGCADNWRDQIQSPDPVARARSIAKAAQWSDRKAIPLIVDRLEDEDGAVRMVAIMALKQIVGKDFGYRPYDPLHLRSLSVRRWRDWWNRDRIKGPSTRPVTTTGPTGRMK